MTIYWITVNPNSINKAFALFYETKVAQDIINNVIAGEIEVKNQEAYDKMYANYIKNSIAYDREIRNIEEEILGKDIIIPSSVSYVSPIRGKFMIQITSTDEEKKKDIEAFLLRKGFERIDIE